jgi:organic hydroperoxide reductase OsmC/OhrA
LERQECYHSAGFRGSHERPVQVSLPLPSRTTLAPTFTSFARWLAETTDQATFDRLAEAAEKGCPVSRLLNAEITLSKTLK